MAAETVVIHLRVLDKKKSKFSHFELPNVPKFSYPEEFKQYLLEKHENVIQPAKTTSFKLGYFIEGRGNKKFDIVDQQTLKAAYDSAGSKVGGKVHIWVDPHKIVETTSKPAASKEKTAKGKKRGK